MRSPRFARPTWRSPTRSTTDPPGSLGKSTRTGGSTLLGVRIMEKRKDVVDRLLRSATILFGEKRAEEIRESLKERAEQLWRVSRAAPEFDGEEPACRFDLGESSPGDCATERRAPSDRSTPRRSSSARSGPPQDPAEMTASEAAAQIRAGSLTAAELVEACRDGSMSGSPSSARGLRWTAKEL